MNSNGLYSLSEMWDRVARALKLNQAVVNTTTQAEISNTFPSQAFSQVDLTQQLNAALVGIYTEIIKDRPDQFSVTSYVSVQNGNPGPYGFPFNMLQLRYMDWIDPSIGQANAEMEDWVPMLEMADPIDRQMTGNFRGPTWQFDNSGTAFILNSDPTQDNPNGVRIKAVVLPAQLVNPGDYIQARFARVMQECVVLDAAIALGKPRNFAVVASLEEDRTLWHQRLVAIADNAYHPTSVVMVSSRMPANTYSGRWGRSRW